MARTAYSGTRQARGRSCYRPAERSLPDPNGVTQTTLAQTLAALVQDAEGRRDKLRYLLDVLEGDGYLLQDGGRYRFRSPLLREYWRRRVAA